MEDITVVIPVGPQKIYANYLPECIESIKRQSLKPFEIILVDDMHGLSPDQYPDCTLIQNKWLCGCGLSWNFGVAAARTNCVFLMGSDDIMLDGCLEECVKAYRDPEGFYNVTCETSAGEKIDLPNNAAMVTKALWKKTGGFPITSTLGAPDALLISIMLKHMSEHIHQVKQGTPLYHVRVHPEQDTGRYAAFFNWEVIQVRNKETERWQPPQWGRM